jgi:hypothetical protein
MKQYKFSKLRKAIPHIGANKRCKVKLEATKTEDFDETAGSSLSRTIYASVPDELNNDKLVHITG